MTQPQSSTQITVGDVWDALEGAGFQVTKAATGARLLSGPQDRSILLHGPELVGWRPASAALLAEVAPWGIHPVASGKYSPPAGAGHAATEPYSPPLTHPTP